MGIKERSFRLVENYLDSIDESVATKIRDSISHESEKFMLDMYESITSGKPGNLIASSSEIESVYVGLLQVNTPNSPMNVSVFGMKNRDTCSYVISPDFSITGEDLELIAPYLFAGIDNPKGLEDEIARDLNKDFNFTKMDSILAASESHSRLQGRIADVYNNGLSEISTGRLKGELIGSLAGIEIDYDSKEQEDIFELALQEYLHNNNISISDINTNMDNNNISTNPDGLISIRSKGSLAPKIMSVALQEYISRNESIDVDVEMVNFYSNIDKDYKTYNPELEDGNFDYTDAHKNQLGIEVIKAGETINNNLLYRVMQDEDAQDIVNGAEHAGLSAAEKAGEIMSAMDFAYNDENDPYFDEFKDTLEQRLLVFIEATQRSRVIDELPLIKKVQVTENIYKRLGSLDSTSDNSYQESLLLFIQQDSTNYQEEALDNVSIRIHSGSNFENGFTSEIKNTKEEVVASVSFTDDDLVEIKVNQENNIYGSNVGKIALISAIKDYKERDQGSFNPIPQILNPDPSLPTAKKLSTTLKELENQGMITIDRDKMDITITDETNTRMDDRKYSDICKPIIVKNKNKKKNQTKRRGL